MNCSWMLLFFLATATAKPKSEIQRTTSWFLPSPSFPAQSNPLWFAGPCRVAYPYVQALRKTRLPWHWSKPEHPTLNGPGNHSCHSFACVSWFAHVSLSDTFSNLQQMSPNISKCLTIPRSSDLRLGILGMLRFDSPNLCFWHYMDLHGW